MKTETKNPLLEAVMKQDVRTQSEPIVFESKHPYDNDEDYDKV